MNRYFFDYTNNDRSLYDYRGEDFTSSQGAIEFAQAAAQLLKNSLSAEWAEWSIEVRNAEGKKFFTQPVGAAVPIAA